MKEFSGDVMLKSGRGGVVVISGLIIVISLIVVMYTNYELIFIINYIKEVRSMNMHGIMGYLNYISSLI